MSEPQPQPTQLPLTEPEVDLAKLSASQRLDRYLVELADLADAGAGMPIGLLVGQTIIVGTLASEREMADALDGLITALLRTAGDDDDSGDSQNPESPIGEKDVFSLHADAAQARRDAKNKARERYEAEFGDADVEFAAMPRDLAREMIGSLDTTLTLTDVHVVLTGAGAPLDLPIMRVNIHQVAGWWTLPVSPETGHASLTIPR